MAQKKQDDNGIELTITEQLRVIKGMCEVYCKFKEKETTGAISNRTFAEICKECPLSMI